MKTIGYLTLFLLIVALVADRGHGQSGSNEKVKWVGQVLTSMESVKAGMTRGDLEKVFTEEGGLSTRTTRTYVSRDCPYFKVDVEFEPDPGVASGESSKDKIVRISKPYIGWSTVD